MIPSLKQVLVLAGNGNKISSELFDFGTIDKLMFPNWKIIYEQYFSNKQ